MPRFHFRAVTGAGEFVEGEIDAQNEAAVVAQLRDRGHLPLAAEPVGERAGAGGRTLQEWLRQPLFGSGRVRRAEVAIITRELATLLDAGLTVDQSLRLLVDLAGSEAMRRLIADLLQRVQGGAGGDPLRLSAAALRLPPSRRAATRQRSAAAYNVRCPEAQKGHPSMSARHA